MELLQSWLNSMAGALSGASPKVVLDLSPVAFIDSAGLASILSLVKGLPEGGELRIAGARDAVRAVFRLTRLEDFVRAQLPPPRR